MKDLRSLSTTLLVLVLGCSAAAENPWNQRTVPLSVPTEIIVHRSASCSCCGKWLEHMRRHGFLVKDITEENMDAVKDQLGVPPALRSCHTGVVAGHVIEGHVPAADVKKLLAASSGPLGLSVPGMPVGPPGMEKGGRKDAFSVIGFDRSGKTFVFSDYPDY